MNPQDHYLDPVRGAQSQAIEQSGLDAKPRILKKMRGISSEPFPVTPSITYTGKYWGSRFTFGIPK